MGFYPNFRLERAKSLKVLQIGVRAKSNLTAIPGA
jgi:hypothetical protein